LTLAPLWIGLYLYLSFDANLFYSGGFPYIEIAFMISTIFGLLFLRYAPATDGALSTIISVPVALFGFAVAASWIDLIASHLVDLLTFLGVVMQIPNAIMGVTVLAVGNSMSELSADIDLAKKGLANMYVDDARFTAYYDKHKPGLAVIMRDAMLYWADKQEKTEK